MRFATLILIKRRPLECQKREWEREKVSDLVGQVPHEKISWPVQSCDFPSVTFSLSLSLPLNYFLSYDPFYSILFIATQLSTENLMNVDFHWRCDTFGFLSVSGVKLSIPTPLFDIVRAIREKERVKLKEGKRGNEELRKRLPLETIILFALDSLSREEIFDWFKHHANEKTIKSHSIHFETKVKFGEVREEVRKKDSKRDGKKGRGWNGIQVEFEKSIETWKCLSIIYSSVHLLIKSSIYFFVSNFSFKYFIWFLFKSIRKHFLLILSAAIFDIVWKGVLIPVSKILWFILHHHSNLIIIKMLSDFRC